MSFQCPLTLIYFCFGLSLNEGQATFVAFSFFKETFPMEIIPCMLLFDIRELWIAMAVLGKNRCVLFRCFLHSDISETPLLISWLLMLEIHSPSDISYFLSTAYLVDLILHAEMRWSNFNHRRLDRKSSKIILNVLGYFSFSIAVSDHPTLH